MHITNLTLRINDKPDEEVWARLGCLLGTKRTREGYVKKQPADCAGYYPPEAIAAKAEGITKFSLRVTLKGWRDLKLLQSSGNVDLDEGAISCVAKMNLERAFRYSAPIDTDYEITVAWVLDPATVPNPLPPKTVFNLKQPSRKRYR